jgi:predicted extracellular nuclease
LLYNKKLFTVTGTEFLTVKLPDLDKGTRDILYVKGTVKGVEVHFFVDHWPSRRDGKAASQARRYAAATVLHNKVAKILASDPKAHVIIMGDLNDNPVDSSVAFALEAQEPVEPYTSNKLYDLMAKPFKDHKYSLKYRDENDVFDQMIVSGNLLDKAAPAHVQSAEGNIYKANWMLFNHPKYGEMPNRTYSGPIYHGGYSDHLPVYIDLLFGSN